MYKFFVNDEQIRENEVIIIGEDVNHIKNVLRLNVEDTIIVCNRSTYQSFICSIQQIDSEKIMCKIQEELKVSRETNTYIHIFQGLPKADKLEWVIEKCTEIGVKEITPVVMQRTIVKLDEKDKAKKLERWQKIAEVAAKQSQRDIILKVNPVINFKNIFEKVKDYDIVLVAYEEEKETTLKQILRTNKFNNENMKIAVIIGPEGGIEKSEIEQCIENKIPPITLGKRILRTETVALVVSSNILYELEN